MIDVNIYNEITCGYIHEIKLILYNNQDKIINDISLLLTTSETEKKRYNYMN